MRHTHAPTYTYTHTLTRTHTRIANEHFQRHSKNMAYVTVNDSNQTSNELKLAAKEEKIHEKKKTETHREWGGGVIGKNGGKKDE